MHLVPYRFTPDSHFIYTYNMTGLEIYISIVTLFVIGSLTGWVIELFFRRFVSQHKWMNPGFLVGPYLPIYGLGTIGLYGLSNVDLSAIGLPDSNIWGVIVKILMIAVIMVGIEFLAGLIFIKGMKIKLWDYSKRKGNIMGIICPSFSIIWLVVGALYYFLINEHLVTAIYWLASEAHQIYYFFIGIVAGMMLVDFSFSIHLATTIRKAAKENKIIVSLDKLRESAKEKTSALLQINKKGKKKKPSFFFPFRQSKTSIKDQVDDYANNDTNKPDSIDKKNELTSKQD